MFDVEYRGGNAVIFTTKKTKVVFDPKIEHLGVKNVDVRDAVEVATDTAFMIKNDDVCAIFEGPGEYEIGDVVLTGVAAFRHIDNPAADKKESTMYRLSVGDINIAVIGNIAPELTEAQLEKIGVIDIAVIPVGGNGYTLDAASAKAVARQLEPKVVIPVHYADNTLSYEVPQDDFEVFASEMGVSVIEAGLKWKVKNFAALPEQLTIVKIARG